MIDIMSGTDTDAVSSSNPKKGSKAVVVVAFLCVVALAAGGAYWVKSHSKQAGGVDSQASEEAVRAADAQWSKAAAANDVDGTVAFYSDDALVLPPNAAMATDKGAERKEWSEILAPGTSLSWTAATVVASKDGDVVYDVGVYTLVRKAGKGKQMKQTVDGGKYLAVWKQQADGKWKAVAAEWNSDKELPGKV